MFNAKLIVMVALALLFIQLECAAACAAQVCSVDSGKTQSAPPCHPQRDGSSSCPNQIASTAATAPRISQVDIPNFPVVSLAAPVSAVIPARSRTYIPNSSASSPPQFQNLSSVILRI
jgi:hypothetical protein